MLSLVLTQLTILIMTALPQPAQALEQDLQLWTPVILDGTIKGRFRGYFEVIPRVGDGVSRMSQFLIRPGIEYRVNKGLSLFNGYAWIRTASSGGPLDEHRIWQQALFNKQFKRFTLLNRTRLEERMFEHLNGAGVRLRHMVKVSVPLNKRLYAAASNELFVNLNSVNNGPQGGFDQNRLFVGLGVRPWKNARVEGGYQYQHVNRTDQFDDLANHAIVIQSFIGLTD